MAAEHKNLHIIAEALGVISGITLLAMATKIPKYKNVLRTIGLTTLAVDLYFISTWMEANNVNYIPNQ